MLLQFEGFSRVLTGIARGFMWKDSKTDSNRTKKSNRRLQNFLRVNASDILIVMEKKLLWEKVEMLEDPGKFGKFVIGLRDMGYSLLHRWEEE